MKEKLAQQEEILKKIPGMIGALAASSVEEIRPVNKAIYMLGAGKASLGMARQLIENGNRVIDGIIISPQAPSPESGYQVFKGSHPYPTDETVAASYELMQLAEEIPSGAEVVFCLSGGASAMLTIPPYGVEIEELQLLYKLLLNSGASIHEMNVVRKHVCDLKGGKLGAILKDTRLTTLISSDVPGDDPEIIGSGPTIPDSSTFENTLDILKQYDLWDQVPESIQNHILFGVDGIVPENPKPDVDTKKWNHKVRIISKSTGLAENLAYWLREQGYACWVAPESYDEAVRDISKTICSKAISILSGNSELKKPAALIYHGESTVEVTGKGKGGRNQELALMAALSIEGQHPISLLSMGTDGIDGPTDSGGAIVNSQTTLAARKKKLEPEVYLKNNDSYHFHKEMETHIKTGPTGINLMDLQVVLIN